SRASGSGGQSGANSRSTLAGSTGGQAATSLPAGSASGTVQAVTAQTLQSLLQVLGRPLSGVTTQAQPVVGGAAGGGAGESAGNTANKTLSLQLDVDTVASHQRAGSASSAARPVAPQVSVQLPMSAEADLPAPGTPVRVSLPTAAAGTDGPDLVIDVLRPAPTQSVEAPSRSQLAARQGSVADLAADLFAARPSQGAATTPVGDAIERVLALTVRTGQADEPATVPQTQTREAQSSALGLARSLSNAVGGQANVQTGTSGLQSAVAALARALGLAVPSATSAQATPAPGQAPATSATSAGGQPTTPSTSAPLPLPQQGATPTKLPALPVPLPLDVSDPATQASLQQKAEGASARLQLLQPTLQEPAGAQARAEASVVTRVDVPLLIGQEVAVLGIAIERDGGGGSSGSEHADDVRWRFKFAFEAHVTGGVEGVVVLHPAPQDDARARDRLDIGVWASDEEMLSALRGSRAVLVRALDDLGLSVTSLTLGKDSEAPDPSAGAPDRAATAHHLLDTVS
ncbi:MAG: hypothetical protein KI785_01570, partial [Devosiaceae bacterium]|nr:hypothetical protein [Devosiaceae bacterium MH13]